MACMNALERPLTITWQHRVFFTHGVLTEDNDLLRRVLQPDSAAPRARVLVAADAGLLQAQPDLPAAIERYFHRHAGALELAAPPLALPGGEAAKNDWRHVEELLGAVDRCHLDRHSYLIGIGGGALLDLAGLAAALAHRGLRHVRLPTTVLAQADSGVGVKNGVNAFGKKNFLGTFAPPWAVINDSDFLRTLSARDRRAGLVEAVKVACLKDAAFFAQLEREAAALASFESAATQRAIRRCAELHVEHIVNGGDPFELGSARPLDFGHWAAHKLECLSGHALRHGEAVAIGLAVDVVYARRAGLLPEAAAGRILGLLRRLGLALSAPELEARDASGAWLLWEGLREFQEHLGGRLTLTLLRGLGQGCEVHALERPLVEAAVRELRQTDAAG